MRYSVIIAGGAGTRLWPMSRTSRPKQLLPLVVHGDSRLSLLQVAAARLEGVVPPEGRYVCAAESMRRDILAALPSLADERFLGEPMGRDTVNAVGLTAAVLLRRDPEAVFAVFTADHLIEPQGVFARCIDTGFRLVEADRRRLVTFSIVPTHPATGYGYVERAEPIPGFENAYRAARFVEKPDLETARGYLATGRFGWNSGMFVFSARTVMESLRRFKPDAEAGLSRIAEAWGTPRAKAVLEETYPGLPRISVDFALMEPASRDRELTVCTVPMELSWKDVGSWPSYGETLDPDASGNRSNCPAVHLGSRNVLAVSDDPAHTVATIGLEDVIVVRTADATLVCRGADAERVKEMAGRVGEGLR